MEFDAEKFDWLINESILTFNLGGDLLMHYHNPEAVEDKHDPSWQNQAVYFWYDNEPFERKSLPDEFDNFEKQVFTISQIPEGIKIKSGQAMPWFGKPGGVTKLFFSYLENPITLQEAYKLNAICYVEKVSLTIANLGILQDRDNYRFITEKGVSFDGSLPVFEGKKTSLSALYAAGKISILKLK